jgi:hypothetical protein
VALLLDYIKLPRFEKVIYVTAYGLVKFWYYNSSTIKRVEDVAGGT